MSQDIFDDLHKDCSDAINQLETRMDSLQTRYNALNEWAINARHKVRELEKENELLAKKLAVAVEALNKMDVQNTNENYESNYVQARNALEQIKGMK